jgi:hypothetical protein
MGAGPLIRDQQLVVRGGKAGRLAIVLVVLGSLLGQAVHAGQPATQGQWSAVQQWPAKAVHAHLLPDGRVMVWPSRDGDPIVIWNPAVGTFERQAAPGLNLFCSGHTLMADGSLFVAGGHIDDRQGTRTATIYNARTDRWARIPRMNAGRWYPTTTVLANGAILTISGSIRRGTLNPTPQVWDIGRQRWRTLSGARLTVPMYPRMFVAPNGQAFMAGPEPLTRYLDSRGVGRWGRGMRTRLGRWRSEGISVMYAPGRILIAGGSDAGVTTSTAEMINLLEPAPAWTRTGSMAHARRYANATLLPTGQVLVTGGTRRLDDAAAGVNVAEMWDPSTGDWTTLSRGAVYRGYHSVALLLPDGRVLVAGGERSGTNAEIFSPPYLFKGRRPTITSAPVQVAYGERFRVDTPHVSGIRRVRWLRLGSVTHSFNQSQGINQLTFVRRAGHLVVRAPTDPNLATPGYYMLFILNGNGVPSVATIVRLRAA